MLRKLNLNSKMHNLSHTTRTRATHVFRTVDSDVCVCSPPYRFLISV